MTSRFLSPLDLRDENADVKHGKRFQLLAPLIYDSAILACRVVVSAGFVTDLASIPRALYIALPPTGAYDKAGVVHDWLYRLAKGKDGIDLDRKTVDRVLREACEACGVGWFTRQTIYLGVRVGGWVPWTAYRQQPEVVDV